MGETHTFSTTYGLETDTAARARHALADFALRHDVDPDTVDAVSLAVSEAVTNVIRHAYRDEYPGEVRVAADANDGHIVIVVEDDGCGHQTPSPQPGLGYGLRVIDQAAETAHITERPGAAPSSACGSRVGTQATSAAARPDIHPAARRTA